MTARQVLIVDDNRDAAETLALVMEQLGWETRVAYDAPPRSQSSNRTAPSWG